MAVCKTRFPSLALAMMTCTMLKLVASQQVLQASTQLHSTVSIASGNVLNVVATAVADGSCPIPSQPPIECQNISVVDGLYCIALVNNSTKVTDYTLGSITQTNNTLVSSPAKAFMDATWFSMKTKYDAASGKGPDPWMIQVEYVQTLVDIVTDGGPRILNCIVDCSFILFNSSARLC